MKVNPCCARVFGDPDRTFGYTTTARVIIRDKRLGVLHGVLTFLISVYIFVYQIGFLQQFRKEGGVSGSARLQLKAPADDYRTADPPFCVGANTTTQLYAFPQRGYYVYTGGGGGIEPQGRCPYLDEISTIYDPLENGALLLPTRITITNEVLWPQPQCSRGGQRGCSWANISEELVYLPDVEFSTLKVDHTFTALLGSLSRSSIDMTGRMIGPEGQTIHACDAYTRRGMACPPFISIGQPGRHDIFSIQSLLDAVGIASLDEVGGGIAGLDDGTLRYGGFVVLLSITYSNYFLPDTFGLRHALAFGTSSFDDNSVSYVYRVSAVPRAEYKAETVEQADLFALNRTVHNIHGIRVIVSQTGRIGAFDVQTLFINIFVGLGLLAFANAAVDCVALRLCPLRRVYRQYVSRPTVRLSEIFESLPPDKVKQMLREFEENDHLIDPIPEGVQKWQAIAAQHGRDRASSRTRAGSGGSNFFAPSGSGNSYSSSSSSSGKGDYEWGPLAGLVRPTIVTTTTTSSSSGASDSGDDATMAAENRLVNRRPTHQHQQTNLLHGNGNGAPPVSTSGQPVMVRAPPSPIGIFSSVVAAAAGASASFLPPWNAANGGSGAGAAPFIATTGGGGGGAASPNISESSHGSSFSNYNVAGGSHASRQTGVRAVHRRALAAAGTIASGAPSPSYAEAAFSGSAAGASTGASRDNIHSLRRVGAGVGFVGGDAVPPSPRAWSPTKRSTSHG